MKRCAANYENTRTFAGGKTRNSTDLPSFAKRFERCYEQNEDNYHNCNLNFAGKVTTKRSEVKWRQTFWSRSSWAGFGNENYSKQVSLNLLAKIRLGGKSCGIAYNNISFNIGLVQTSDHKGPRSQRQVYSRCLSRWYFVELNRCVTVPI